MQRRATTAGGVLILALGIPAFAAEHPGKAIYDRTCKECHGEKGAGSAMADKFYKLTIPRLNSKYVQDKSDTELKETITKGRRQMKPVRPGQPTMQHSVKAEWVDDVVGYVRGLKK